MKLCKHNIIKVIALLLFIFGATNTLFSQERDSTKLSRNTFYIDFSSKGAYYSINYDRVFSIGKKLCYSYRLGFSVLENAIALPLGINLCTGKGSSHAEFSLTLMPYMDEYKSFLSSNDLSDKYLYVIPAVGYRYQKRRGGLFFKLALSPMLVLDPPSSNFWKMDPKMYAAGNIGVGWSF